MKHLFMKRSCFWPHLLLGRDGDKSGHGNAAAVNVKWLLLLALSAAAILHIRRRACSRWFSFGFFMVIIVMFMPLGFISGGGGRSDFIAFSFFVLILVTYILEGRFQTVGAAMIVAGFVALHVFEFLFPHMIPVYDPVSRFYDRLIQVPLMLILSYHTIKFFANAYNETNKKLLYCANYDMLTGLLNRWALNERLQAMLSSADAKGYLVFLDIDKFKLINDRKGHAVGDAVLRQFGAILKHYFENGRNLVCRWGGDEFVVFYFDDFNGLDRALKGATHDFLAYINGIERQADISFGIASLDGFTSVADVFTKSDELMYKQNFEKRN
jgi:diguanylate cyclase (GGDEF)-like protein